VVVDPNFLRPLWPAVASGPGPFDGVNDVVIRPVPEQYRQFSLLPSHTHNLKFP
jgi:hypothetical protein